LLFVCVVVCAAEQKANAAAERKGERRRFNDALI
jgi:hypothetical protein